MFFRALRYADLRALHTLVQFRSLREEFYADLWLKTAEDIGAQIQKTRYGYFRISRGNLTTFVEKHRVMLDDHLTLNLMGNKALTYEVMSEKGVPVPSHTVFTLAQMQLAQQFLEQQTGPIVVKPARATGAGRGVTTAIADSSALNRAARQAARYGSLLVAEQQIAGSSFRLLYLDGMLIDAIRRDPPRLRGNGNATIKQLLRAENRRRLASRPIAALSPLVIDPEFRNTLAARGLNPRSRPADGESIVVKHAANENTAAENIRVTDQVNAQTVETGSRLVKDLGIRLAGLDVLCRDISAPLSPGNGLFGEINTTPGLHHHYLVEQPDDRVHVASQILDHMFTHRSGVMVL